MKNLRHTTITLFEHQFRSFTEMDMDSEHPLILGIEQLNQSQGKDLVILQRKGIKATQFVGVIRTGQITLQILPKIDYSSEGDANAALFSAPHNQATSSATSNLLFLLSYALDLAVYEKEIAGLSHQALDWSEFLTRLLASDLHRLMKRGLLQNYITREDRLPVMRGRWRIEQQLIRQPHVKHRFDVRFDEFSPDIFINQVFRLTVENLLFQTRDPGNRRMLTDVYDWLSPVRKLGFVSSSDLDRVIFTRLNEHYRPVFNLARMFLEHSTPLLSVGNTKTFAFVFDMNLLFERFVGGFLARQWQAIFPTQWEEIQTRFQANERSFYLAKRTSDEKSVFKLIPDILLENRWGQQTRLVVDTKYKHLNPEQRKLGVSEGDFYQMLAYLKGLECPRGLILYPQTASRTKLYERFEVKHQDAFISAATINLRQPLQDVDVLIQEFRELFTQILQFPA
jgi:5-methylcytosine-specific restriction enzyme subunit McrC